MHDPGPRQRCLHSPQRRAFRPAIFWTSDSLGKLGLVLLWQDQELGSQKPQSRRLRQERLISLPRTMLLGDEQDRFVICQLDRAV